MPATAWETRSCGPGCKGHRDYEWAYLATASPRRHLLIRRGCSDPSDLAFFCCYAPGLVSCPVLIHVAGKRWPAGECFQQGKGQAGLDQHQVRLWQSFHRHTVLAMYALALLAVATARPPAAAQAITGDVPPDPQATAPAGAAALLPVHWRDTGALPSRADQKPPADIGMVKVSVPEARRLLRLATTPMRHAEQVLHCHWSRWRRGHQARARYHHYQAQLRAAPT